MESLSELRLLRRKLPFLCFTKLSDMIFCKLYQANSVYGPCTAMAARYTLLMLCSLHCL